MASCHGRLLVNGTVTDRTPPPTVPRSTRASGACSWPLLIESALNERTLGGEVGVEVGVVFWWKPNRSTSTRAGLDQASKGATRVRRGFAGMEIELYRMATWFVTGRAVHELEQFTEGETLEFEPEGADRGLVSVGERLERRFVKNAGVGELGEPRFVDGHQRQSRFE